MNKDFNYEIGMKFRWIPDSKFDQSLEVEVAALRKGLKAKLSNGWVVDEFGIAEGNARISGGRIEKIN